MSLFKQNEYFFCKSFWSAAEKKGFYQVNVLFVVTVHIFNMFLE